MDGSVDGTKVTTMDNKNISLSSRQLIEESDSGAFRDSRIGEESLSTSRDWEVLTISLDNNEKSSQRKKTVSGSCLKYIFNNHTLLLSTLACSFILTIVPIILLNVIETNVIGLTGRNILLLVRHAGLYSFTGGISVTVAMKVCLKIKAPFFKNYLKRRTEAVKLLMKQFLLSEIFEERFVKQYMQRAECVQQVESLQSNAILMDSLEYKELLTSKYNAIEQSPEGAILDSLGIQRKELEQYFQVFITEFLVDFQKISTDPDNRSVNPKLFRRYVENILVEKMSIVDDVAVCNVIQETFIKHLDLVVLLVTVFMVIFGILIGSIIIFV